ncbi:hypothetical protein KUTeg_015085 [Tegillarca granosa]|uniref:Sodium-dependent glucose transporter 1 n=1 Tax=Tegillarca granosa TaxID=220873 RepID=A0ABQ9ESP9_TEGGR|nr:hypothetical protein KUTeg_015085 [Tegillarca granosa]
MIYQNTILVVNAAPTANIKDEMGPNKTNQLNEPEGKTTSELDKYNDDSNQSFKTKLRHNKEYRINVMVSRIKPIRNRRFSEIHKNGLTRGWKVAQIGPSLLDLQIIANTTLDKISGIYTSDAIGYLGGTILGGFLFSKFNSAILLFTSAVCSAFTIAIIPWCSVFEAMVAIFASIRTIYLGNAEVFRIWKTDNAPIVQALHFFYAIGGAFSPTITAPFLMPPSRDHSNNTKDLPCATYNETNGFSNVSKKMDNCSFILVNEDKPSHQHKFDNESKLYIAYLITASMYVVSGFFLLFSYFKIDKDFFQRAQNKKKDNDLTEHPSFREKLPMLILVASLTITYVVVQASISEFLSAFFVEQLNWTKTSASYLTSVFWATFALGRSVSIFLLKYIKSSHLLGITSAILNIGSFGIFISSLYIFTPGLWISVGLCGLSMSPMFPTLFTWTNSELIPVNASINSLIFAAGASTAIINPIILGYLMDNVDKMAFCYFIVGGTVSFKLGMKFKKDIFEAGGNSIPKG